MCISMAKLSLKDSATQFSLEVLNLLYRAVLGGGDSLALATHTACIQFRYPNCLVKLSITRNLKQTIGPSLPTRCPRKSDRHMKIP